MAKLLLIDDDIELSRKVKDWLEFEHHTVETAFGGNEAIEKLKFFQYDMVILDWGLPDVDGIEVLKTFRNEGGDVPVLMLTGKNQVSEVEAGLNNGADDYVTKPFDLRELSARVRAMVRRNSKVYDKVLKVRDLELDSTSHKAWKSGEELKLQPREFAVLEFLLRNPTDVFSVDALLERIWSSDSDASPDTVRVCITRLRNKIDTPGRSSVIKTVHRIGYQLDADDAT